MFKEKMRDPSGTALSARQNMAAAGAAGVCALAVTNPFWVVKTRMSLQVRTPKSPGALAEAAPAVVTAASAAAAPQRYRNVVDGLWRVARDEGLRGLYKGVLFI